MGLFGGGKGKGGSKGGSSKGGSKSSSSSSSKSSGSKSSDSKGSKSSGTKSSFGSKIKGAVKKAFGGGSKSTGSKSTSFTKSLSSSKPKPTKGSKSLGSKIKSAFSGGISKPSSSKPKPTKGTSKLGPYKTSQGTRKEGPYANPFYGQGRYPNRDIGALGLGVGGPAPYTGGSQYSYTDTTNFAPEAPQEESALTDIEAWIENMQEQGYEINPELDLFDQNTLDRFLETAKRQVRPEFAQQIDAIKYDVIRDMGQLKSQYEGDVADREAQFTGELGNFREGTAGAGLAFSGQRGSGELGMQAAQNRNLDSLGLGFKNDINRMGRAAEQKIGAGNVDYTAPNVRSYSANLDNFPKFQTGDNLGGYTKGAFQVGDIQRDEEAAARNRAEAIKYQAGVRKRAGRSYQDLFN